MATTRLFGEKDKKPRGKGMTASDLASIAEVQSLLRSLRDIDSTSGRAAQLLRKRQGNRDEERASTSLRKRMPMCRYQSLPDFEAGEAVLSQLADGALPAHPAIGSRSGGSPVSFTRPRSNSRSMRSLPVSPDISMEEDSMMSQASASSRLPRLKLSSSAPRLQEGSTLAATRSPVPANPRNSISEESSVQQSPLSGRQGPDMVVRPPSHYEATCARQAMLPKFARTAQTSCSGGTLDLTGSGLGDRQLVALLRDTSLVPLNQIRRWKLRDSRLGDSSAKVLAESMRDDVELVDLACNKLTTEGCLALASLMCDRPLYKLRKLDLSGNSIGDEAMGPLSEGLAVSTALLRLDMNSNVIRDGVKLGNFIAGHAQLTRLSLRRNYLSGEGSAALFDGVLRNSKAGFALSDVDIAWNSIGNSNSVRAAMAIAAVLRESATLYHCDLSYNGIDAASCGILSESLRDNHSLYGLHIVGNAVTMDADGFLTPLDDANIQQQMQGRPNPRFGDLMGQAQNLVGASRASASHGRRSVDTEGLSSIATCRSAHWSIEDDLRGRDVSERQTACWACEGWERVELEWVAEPGLPEPKAVWAYTCLDGFRKGLRLHRAKEPSKDGQSRFLAARMVPPGWRLRVIYQVDTAIFLPQGCPTEILNPSADIRLRACEELQNLEPPRDQLSMIVEWDGPVPTLRVDRAGVIDRSRYRPGGSRASAQSPLARRRSVVLDGLDGGPPVTLLRVTESEFKITVEVARGRAYYADFRVEDPLLHKQCFELDWSRCRLGRIVPEAEVPAIKELLQAEYGKLIAIYRRFSALDNTGDSELGVTQLQASEIIISSGLGGDAHTKIADIDRFFIAAKVTPNDLKKELVVVNDKSLVRYEFLEFLVRIAHQRFLSRGVVESMHEAMVCLLEALEVHAKELDAMNAFFHSMHTEAVDDVFKKHSELVESVYKKHSGSRTLPGRPKTMVLIEFKNLIEVLDVYDVEFQARNVGVAFRMGMMTQKDESASSRFQEMTFVEFQHALGAVMFLKEGFVSQKMPALLDAFMQDKLPEGLKQVISSAKRMTTKGRGSQISDAVERASLKSEAG